MLIKNYSHRRNRPIGGHAAQILANIKKEDVGQNMRELWCMEYPADPILEPDLVGLTYGQVALYRQMHRASAGSGEAFDRVLDRMVGKPLQATLNKNINGTYKDFLEEVAKEEGNIIDVEARPG